MKPIRWQFFTGCMLLSLIVLVYLSPILWVALTSVKSRQEIYATEGFRFLPSRLTWEHFQHVLSQYDDFKVYTFNTLVVTTATILLVTLCSSLCGYALAQLHFRGSGLLIAFLLGVMSAPWVMMLIPIYRMELNLGLLNTLPGLIFPYTAFFMPMAILIMRSAFLTIPSELRQAAMVDGASEWVTWWRVMLPLVRPSLTVVALTTFLSCWKEFTLAISLNSLPSATTLAVGITYLQDEAQSWAYGTLSAVVMICVIPLLLLFLVFQRQIIGGLTEGAQKG